MEGDVGEERRGIAKAQGFFLCFNNQKRRFEVQGMMMDRRLDEDDEM